PTHAVWPPWGCSPPPLTTPPRRPPPHPPPPAPPERHRRQDHGGAPPPLCMLSNLFEKGEAVHARHQEIEQDHRRLRVLRQPAKGDGAVRGFRDLPAQPVEVPPRQAAAFVLVIDDQHNTATVDMLADRRREPRAVDRLGQELGGAE